MSQTFSFGQLCDHVNSIFKALKVPADRAEILSRCLVESDQCGLSSHGVIRIPIYVKRIQQGLTETTKSIDIVKDFPASTLYEGNNVIGQVACELSMENAIKKARSCGIGISALRNTNHSGACGHYSLMAAKENMIGFSFVNTTPLVAVFGGTHKAVGNNPLSIAIPSGKAFPILLDMACSVAQGKIEVLQKEGKSIPSGWAVDENGKPTTDPAEALKGVLLPIAGPKGSGLAIVIDVICGILTGAGVGAEVKHLNDKVPQNIGAVFIAIDISKFVDVDEFLDRVDSYITYLKGTATASECILMPGEREFIINEERKKNGIPIPEKVVADLNKIAVELGIESRL